jgi:hypothetical protein
MDNAHVLLRTKDRLLDVFAAHGLAGAALRPVRLTCKQWRDVIDGMLVSLEWPAGIDPSVEPHWGFLDRLPALTTVDVNVTRLLRRIEPPLVQSLTRLQHLTVRCSAHDAQTLESDMRRVLAAMRGLVSIMVVDAQSMKMDFSSEQNGLEKVTVKRGLMTHIQGLSALPRLHTLSISLCTQMLALPELQELTQLRMLSIAMSCNHLTSLGPLHRLSQLQVLVVNDCTSLTQLEGLSGLSSLRTLRASCNKRLAGVDGLSVLMRLQTLSVSNSALSTTLSLGLLTDLRSLNISKTRIRSLEGLSSLVRLTKLMAYDCSYLVNLPHLGMLQQLRMLKLSYAPASISAQHIGDLRSLQVLHLHCCANLAGDLPLGKLTALRSLQLRSCRSLTGILGLGELRAVQSLMLSGCRSMAGELDLSNLSQLHTLHVRSCRSLTCIKGLSNLPGHGNLSLEFNTNNRFLP